MKVDMSPQAVTNRMIALDQLWELAVALKSSKMIETPDSEEPLSADTPSQNSEE